MASLNFQHCLTFVWRPGYDDPSDGYHVTPGDSGGGTLGGITEATWADALVKGWVTGTLAAASNDSLATILKNQYWGAACEALPSGVDLLLFNGRMMSGGYPKLFQSTVGANPDGNIGPKTIAATIKTSAQVGPAKLIEALTVAHFYYLSQLGPSWIQFHNGWEGRLLNAYTAALAMAA